jgi:hypothetical protein
MEVNCRKFAFTRAGVQTHLLRMLGRVHQAKSKVASKSSKFMYRSSCNHASSQPASNGEARTTCTKLVGCFHKLLSSTKNYPGTIQHLLLFSDITCHVCYQATPYRSDQGADLGRHVGELDKYMIVDYLQVIEDVHIITYDLARRPISKRSDRTGEGRTRCNPV